MDNIKDTISNGAMKAYEGIEKLEEKMGLYEYTFTKEEAGEAALNSYVQNVDIPK